MSWQIVYTDEAWKDLIETYEYILYDLSEPQTAKKWYGNIIKSINSLAEHPRRHRVFDGEPWHSQGLRFFPVGNYLILYTVEEEQQTVTVIRIVYGSRDLNIYLRKFGGQ